MREILFRGKRTDNGEWVEGYYIHRPAAVCIGESNPSCIWVPAADPDDDTKIFEVFPETVGQYTGLTDKNGRKIFEGDIINYKGALAHIIYSTEKAGFYAVFSSWYTDLSALSAGKYVSVIGNICDNPELLKGGNENG